MRAAAAAAHGGGGGGGGLFHRGYATVYAWGRGLEGQTGVEGGPASAAVVTKPTALLDLHGRDVARLSAGRLSSCAVTSSGEAYTWGDGRSGLLGHGSGRAALRVTTPQRVEALYGRSAGGVAAAALGDAHALFVSSDGACHACGENKEGQLGLGTPLEVLAAQHRRALGVGGGGAGGAGGGGAGALGGGGGAGARLIREAALAAIRGNGRPSLSSSLAAAWPGSSSSAGGGGSGGGGGFGFRRGGGSGASSSPLSSQQQQQQQPQTSLRELLYAGRPSSSSSSSSSPFWPGGGGAPSPLHASWAGAGASARRGGAGRLGLGHGLGSAALGGGGGVGSGWDSGLAPGQVGHPVRVGSDAHALWGDDGGDGNDDAANFASGSSGGNSSPSSSLLSERVVSASASRYCSALVTQQGEVFTFGSDFNGALGSADGATWQPGPRRVGGALGQAIADRGGAVAVATGGGFAAALTRDGGVLVWGKLGGVGNGDGGSDGPAAAATPQQKRGRRGGNSTTTTNGSAVRAPSASPISVRPVAGAAMPAWALGGGSGGGASSSVRFAAIAAGQRHLLLSDADGRVWAAGSWLDTRGRAAGAAPVARPKLLLDLGCEGGVARLAAGPLASAVVSGDGRLYLWGRLLDRGIAEEAWLAAAAAAAANDGGGPPSWAAAALERQRNAADFFWAGFGGDRPRLVPELTGVRDVALGGHHALALVD